LTWDEPEFDRRKLERWDRDRFTKKGGGIKTDQLEMFLGSEDDDEEDEEEAAKRVERYRALLDRPSHSTSDNVGKAGRAQTKAETEDGAQPTNGNEAGSDEDSADDGGLQIVFSDDDEDAAQQTSDLEEGEDDGDEMPTTKMPALQSKSLAQKGSLPNSEPLTTAKHKAKKKKKRAVKEEGDIDVGDSRFADLYTDPKFTLDRTDPRFKMSKVTKKIDEEKRKRRKVER